MSDIQVRKCSLEELALEEKHLGDARLSIRDAEERLAEAKKHLAQSTNVYVCEGDENQTFVDGSSKAVPRKIPKDGTFELYNGEKKSWKSIAKSTVARVSELASEQDGWAKLWAFSSLKTEGKAATKEGPAIVRVSATVPVSPELLLLTQLRCSAQGVLDPSLIFMRDHHTFSDGKTSLRHSVRNVGPAPFLKRDYVDLTTYSVDKETGTIVFGSTSVPKAFPANVVDKWYQMASVTRGDVCIFGMQITPVEVKPSALKSLFSRSKKAPKVVCRVTVVSQVDWKGNAPQMWVDWKNKTSVIDYIKRAEQQAQEWVSQGVADELVGKYLPKFAKEAKDEQQ